MRSKGKIRRHPCVANVLRHFKQLGGQVRNIHFPTLRQSFTGGIKTKFTEICGKSQDKYFPHFFLYFDRYMPR